MNLDPAVHHPGAVMPLEVAVILPAGLPASSSPCRRPAQAGPAPVPPQALLSAAHHPSFILPGVCSLLTSSQGAFPVKSGLPW